MSSQPQKQLVVSATFTVEPLEAALAFWGQKLSWQSSIVFAPYNQVFQELVNPDSDTLKNRLGANLLLLRLEDWRGNGESKDAHLTEINKNLQEFESLITSASNNTSVPFIVALCPASPTMANELGAKLEAIGEQLASVVKDLATVYFISPEEIAQRYGVEEFYDADSDEMGHIPYTGEYFTALGSAIARCYDRISKPPYKAVILDCDETLWTGIAGEDGPDGVQIDNARIYLQEFMLKQREAGKVLCLNSKNVPEDVDAIFNRHQDMPLQKSHVALEKVNWQPKSQNIHEIAQELNLGMDSFIFVDDNAVEIAEVAAACPTVEGLNLPRDTSLVKNYLDNAWVFDTPKVTSADKKRAQQYQENIKRDQELASAGSLSSFIASLDLKVEFSPLTLDSPQEQLERCAQLTQRTNQFNFTTIRRNEAELKQLLSQEQWGALVIHVNDRFGDYGLVGFVLYQADANRLEIDTYLLSCRVLGRGVEYQILSTLGGIAAEKSLETVSLKHLATAKNLPALNFMNAACSNYIETVSERESLANMPVSYVTELKFDADKSAEDTEESNSAEKSNASTDATKTQQESLTISYHQIASQLNSVKAIHEAILAEQKHGRSDSAGEYVEPETDLEIAIAEIWMAATGLDRVGVFDNFFELGGTSLQATQAISRINANFEIHIGLREFFDNPTLEQMSYLIEDIILAEIENLDE